MEGIVMRLLRKFIGQQLGRVLLGNGVELRYLSVDNNYVALKADNLK